MHFKNINAIPASHPMGTVGSYSGIKAAGALS